MPHWTIPTRRSGQLRSRCFTVVRRVRRGRARTFVQSKRSIMKCFHWLQREEQERRKDGRASSLEVQATFAEQRDYLHWIALLITGDDARAGQAVVDASELAAGGSGVFRDWLIQWAKYATARAAIRGVRDVISASARGYANSSCEHTNDEVLSDDQIRSLRHVDPRDLIAALDPLARSALILRGIQRTSISDCALLLDVPRRCVANAYCRACEWNTERESAHKRSGAGRVSAEIPYALAGAHR